jgi:hypothetical protein
MIEWYLAASRWKFASGSACESVECDSLGAVEQEPRIAASVPVMTIENCIFMEFDSETM